MRVAGRRLVGAQIRDSARTQEEPAASVASEAEALRSLAANLDDMAARFKV